jgi:hypothetical protein
MTNTSPGQEKSPAKGLTLNKWRMVRRKRRIDAISIRKTEHKKSPNHSSYNAFILEAL